MRLILEVEVGPPGGLDVRGMEALAKWCERDDAWSLTACRGGRLLTPFAWLDVKSMRLENDES